MPTSKNQAVSTSLQAAAPVSPSTSDGDAATAFHEAVAAIRSQLLALTESDVRSRREIGCRLNDIVNDASGRYGTNPRAELQKIMPLSRDGLRPMMVLAATYTDGELDALLGLRNPVTNECLTWTHFISLLRIKDRDKHIEFAKQTVENGWSTKELTKAVIAAQGRHSGGGRKAKKSATLVACLDDILAKTATWANARDDSWLAAKGGLAELYKQALVCHRMPEDVVAALEQAVGQLDRFLVRVRDVQHQVTHLYQRAKATRAPRPMPAGV